MSKMMSPAAARLLLKRTALQVRIEVPVLLILEILSSCKSWFRQPKLTCEKMPKMR